MSDPPLTGRCTARATCNASTMADDRQHQFRHHHRSLACMPGRKSANNTSLSILVCIWRDQSCMSGGQDGQLVRYKDWVNLPYILFILSISISINNLQYSALHSIRYSFAFLQTNNLAQNIKMHSPLQLAAVALLVLSGFVSALPGSYTTSTPAPLPPAYGATSTTSSKSKSTCSLSTIISKSTGYTTYSESIQIKDI